MVGQLNDYLSYYAAHALPTRSRPQGVLDGYASWLKLRNMMPLHINEKTQIKGQKLKRIQAFLEQWPSNAPTTISFEQTKHWIEVLLEFRNASLRNPAGLPKKKFALICLTHFVEWLISTVPVSYFADVVSWAYFELFEPESDQPDVAQWCSLIALAFRAAIVKAPSTYYEDLIASLDKIAINLQGWDFRCFAAFVLADDRPVQHDLQPQIVLGKILQLDPLTPCSVKWMPLILDSQPSKVTAWRAKHSCYFSCLNWHIDSRTLYATALAVASHYGESALPVLRWLMCYLDDAHKADLAQIILAGDKSDALAALLPNLSAPWTTPCLEKVFQSYSASIFRQCIVELVISNTTDSTTAQIKTVVKSYIASTPTQTLRHWLGEDVRALAYFDYALEHKDNVLFQEDLNTAPSVRETEKTNATDTFAEQTISAAGNAPEINQEPQSILACALPTRSRSQKNTSNTLTYWHQFKLLVQAKRTLFENEKIQWF
jgi:hypothetical protein